MSGAVPASAARAQYEWARELARALVGAGVSAVVVSPGSRSTPFVLALSERADMPCEVVVDERAAAFYALGRAKASGSVVALLCTSGSAAANYLPAIVEADAAFTPLLVLTADRPPRLHYGGANQTMDQLHLYGHHVRQFFEVGEAGDDAASRRALHRTLRGAVGRCLGPLPGPVQVNLRADKPLEPSADDLAALGEPAAVIARPPPAPRLQLAPETLEPLCAALDASERVLVCAGPAAPQQAAVGERLFALCARRGWAFAGEATSQLRFHAARARSRAAFCDALAVQLESASEASPWAPDLVLQLGAAPVAAGWQESLEGGRGVRPRHWVVQRHGWHDAAASAEGLLVAELDEVVDALAEQGPGAPSPADYAAEIGRREERIWKAVEAALAACERLCDGAVCRDLVDGLPENALLALGNSLPVREIDRWAPGSARHLQVHHQRGLSGIDGLLAGALGAHAVSGRPGAILLGDVSLMHDLSSLALARGVSAPFVILVSNNGGGRIFDRLPIAALAARRADFLRFWRTPVEVDLERVAAGFGLPHVRVEERTALRRELADALARGGATVIEAVVDDGAAALRREALQARLGVAGSDGEA